MEWRRLLPNTLGREFGVGGGGLSVLILSLESLRAKGFSRLIFLDTDDMMLLFCLLGCFSNMSCFMQAWSFSRSVSRIRIRDISSLSSRFSLRTEA
jgi:hypothetical protein